MGLARREAIGLVVLVLAPLTYWGLRPAFWTMAPTLALDAALDHTRRDPWGRGLVGPPIGLHDTPQPVHYSMGWNGIDDTRMHTPEADQLNHLDHANLVQLSNTALIDGVLGSTKKQAYTFDLTVTDPVWIAYEEKISRGVLGDDILPTWERSWRTDLVARPLERWSALCLLLFGWVAALRPRAPRDARLAVEGARVVALASLPGVLLGWVALSAGGAELAARLPLLGRPDGAVGGTAALVALLAALWLRASAPAACGHPKT